MTSSQLRNAFKVWLPTECAAFCAAPTEAPSWKAYLLCLEMIFCCGPRTKWGQNFDINIQMVVVSIIPKIFFTKWKGSKLNPNKGGPFLTVPVRATTRGPQPQAIGGAISLKHCVAGVGFERWSFQKGDDGGYLICWNVWKGPDNIHIYNYVYIYYIYIIIYIYCIYICWYINQGSAFFFWGGIISYVLERNDLLIQPTFSLKEAPIFWDLAVGLPKLPSLRLDFVLVTPVL